VTLLATVAAPWTAPTIDYHALAPEIVLAIGLTVVLLVDLFLLANKSPNLLKQSMSECMSN